MPCMSVYLGRVPPEENPLGKIHIRRTSQSNLQTQLPADWRHLAASSTLNPGAAPFHPTFPQSPQHRPRGSNFTAGRPLWCTNCMQRFSSRAQVWDHLQHCRPTATRPLATTLKRKRDNPPPALGPAPLPVLTYADAATAPPAKRHQSIHNSASGTAIPTIALPDGTVYYDTRPPSHTPAMEYAANLRRADTIQQFGCWHNRTLPHHLRCSVFQPCSDWEAARDHRLDRKIPSRGLETESTPGSGQGGPPQRPLELRLAAFLPL